MPKSFAGYRKSHTSYKTLAWVVYGRVNLGQITYGDVIIFVPIMIKCPKKSITLFWEKIMFSFPSKTLVSQTIILSLD